MNAPPPAPAAPTKPIPTWAIVLICLLGGLVLFGGVFGVLAVYGIRKYLANAKTAEARNAVGQIAKDAAMAYEKSHALCASASRPVPASMSALRGMKYQSSPGDWDVDQARNAGFACLQFSMELPQYFQYSYAAKGNEFVATAHGDLNGDGKVSTFIARGSVTGGQIQIEPRVEEIDPEE